MQLPHLQLPAQVPAFFQLVQGMLLFVTSSCQQCSTVLLLYCVSKDSRLSSFVWPATGLPWRSMR
jgi:hypothetical protein